MFDYICSIVEDGLSDLLSVDDEKLLEEAKIHVEKFNNFKAVIEKNVEDFWLYN